MFPSTVREGTDSLAHVLFVSTSVGTRSSLPDRMKTSDSGVDLIPRQALVGLAADARKRKAPPQAERSIPSGGIVGERQLRAESRTSRRGCDRHRHGAGPRDRIRRELFAESTDRATTFREREERRLDEKRVRRDPTTG